MAARGDAPSVSSGSIRATSLINADGDHRTDRILAALPDESLTSGAFARLPKVVYPLWPIDPNLASFDHGSSTGLEVSVSPPDNFAGMRARS